MRAQIAFTTLFNGDPAAFTLDDSTLGVLAGGAYITLPGTSGHFISTPDAAALDLTSDLDLRCEVALTDWTPAARTGLVSKFGSAGQRSYDLTITTTGNIGLRWTADGTTIISQDSTVATGIADGSRRWIRATLDADNGAGGYSVRFFTSTDGVTWTQLGGTRTGGAPTSVFSGAAVLAVGSDSNGTANLANGSFYRAQVLGGIDGTVVLDVDPNALASTDQRVFTATTGQTVTISGASSTVVIPNPGTPLGADDYLVDVTQYLRGVQVRRGRSWTLEKFTAGGATLTLDNRNRWFDPTYRVVSRMTNVCVNPNFETGTTSWAAGSSSTIAQSSDGAYIGTRCLKVTRTGTTGHGSTVHEWGIVPTLDVAYQIVVSVKSFDYTGTIDAATTFYDSAGATLRTDTVPFVKINTSSPVTISPTWQRVRSNADPVPAGAVRAQTVITSSGTTMAVGASFYIDAVVIGNQQDSVTYAYFDGSAYDNYEGFLVLAQAWNGPANASTSTISLVADGSPYLTSLVPGKRVVIDEDGRTLATMKVADWNYDYTLDGDSVATVTCVDAFDELANITTVAGTATVQPSGARIDAVLDAAGWPTSQRAISGGEATLGADVRDDTTPVLTYLQRVEASERGALFVDRDGFIAYRDRGDLQAYTNPVLFGTGGIPFTGIAVEYGKEHLTNNVSVTFAAGTATATDTISQGLYGDIESSFDTLLATTADANAFAAWVLARYAQPVYRITALTVMLTGLPTAQRNAVLDLDLGDVVTVTWTPNEDIAGTVPITQVLTVDGIEHDATPGAHVVTLRLSTTQAAFLLDDALYGLLDLSTLGF